jgi:hydrogenase-1 operon protein HyaF
MSVKAWENGPSYIDMPGSMDRYSAPSVPDPETVRHLDGAREAMTWLQNALTEWRPGGDPLIADLSRLDAANRDLVNQVLGEGEVSVSCADPVNARIQESVLTGVWRSLYFDEQEQLACDLVEVAPVPHIVSLATAQETEVDSKGNGDMPNVIGALPILVELAAARDKYIADGTEHAINLILLPMSEEELGFIDERLGRGPVEFLSQAYGKCQVSSTGVSNIWWTKHYNSMGKLILSLLEVVDVPAIVAAAPEDIDDSAKRLEEILAPYWNDEG